MQLFKLRYFQLKRDLGVWVIIIAGAATGLSYYIATASMLYSLAFLCICLLSLYNYQLYRKDVPFIKHYLDNNKWQIAVNFSLLMLPLSVGVIAARHWEAAAILQVAAVLISFMKPQRGAQKFLFLSRYVPPEQFEWISGLRQSLYVVVILLLIAIVLSPVKFFALLALFLLNITFLSFYNFYEPLLMLNPQNLSAEAFLKQKTDYTAKMLLITNCPLLLINAIFHTDSAWYSLCFIFGFVIFGSCTIFIKYAYYRPNGTQGLRVDSFMLIGGILFPYLLPLCIYLYYSNRKKAIINLSHYLHDTR